MLFPISFQQLYAYSPYHLFCIVERRFVQFLVFRLCDISIPFIYSILNFRLAHNYISWSIVCCSNTMRETHGVIELTRSTLIILQMKLGELKDCVTFKWNKREEGTYIVPYLLCNLSSMLYNTTKKLTVIWLQQRRFDSSKIWMYLRSQFNSCSILTLKVVLWTKHKI